jgi:hypothetical protein
VGRPQPRHSRELLLGPRARDVPLGGAFQETTRRRLRVSR